MNFSDYIIYVDESGDHGLKSIDKQFPIFSLVFIMIEKKEYIENIVPSFMKFKNKYWGHDQIILHESDIRKEVSGLKFLRNNREIRNCFYDDLNDLISKCNFRYISAVIKKENLLTRYKEAHNPYNISLLFCMERTRDYLVHKGQEYKNTTIIIESRGKNEDRDLELEFNRICDGKGSFNHADMARTPFNMRLVKKYCNSAGLQLADLIARPIALSVLRPNQENRAYDIIKSKGLEKIFPNN